MSEEQTVLKFIPRTPVARKADPSTSHASAAEMTKSGTRQRQADLILDLVARHPDKTANELGHMALIEGLMIGSTVDPMGPFHRRLPELADASNGALLMRSGQRECKITGRLATTWRLRT